MTQIRKLLNRREFLQQSGLLGAGAAVTAAQAKADLAKSLLGMGDAAVPAAVPGLDPRSFLSPGLQKGFALPDGSSVISNGKLAYLQYGPGSTASVSKSQKDLIVKLLQEARDSMPQMPTEGVSEYNTLTKNWHQRIRDHARAVTNPRTGSTMAPYRALKAGEPIPAGAMQDTWNGYVPNDFPEFDKYNGSLSTPPTSRYFQGKDVPPNLVGHTERNQIEGFENDWSQTHRSIADMQRTKAKEAGDPNADEAHRKELYDLGLAGTGRSDQPPSVLQDTGEITGNVGLPGESSPDSGARIRKLLALGGVTAAGVGLSSQDAEAAQTGKLIRAFHGSPYSFNKFDASKIGTGSGGAVYGRGWNFSNAERLAEAWREQGSAMRRTPEQDAMQLWRVWAEELGDPERGKQTAIDLIEKEVKESSAYELSDASSDAFMANRIQRSKDVLQHLHSIDYRQPLPKRSGTTYEVEIAHPEQSLLNYDKPFSTPPGAVAARLLRDIDEKSMPSSTLRDIETGAYQGNGGYLDKAAENLRLFASSGGGEALIDAGIPGLRYQQPLRNYQFGQLPAAQEHTTNYLMFPGTEDSINIIRKYAVPALVTAAAATAAGGATAQAQGSSYPVISPEEAGVDQYFQENPQVSGMAWGGGMNGSDPESQRSIVLNPHSKLSPEQYKGVERNEGIRHQMSESNWSSDFEITPEQQEWSKNLGAYANNPAALRETIIARLASGDSVPTPTDEQKQIANTFGDPTAFGNPMPEGLIERGNINLYRPSIPNPEGGDSTVNSISVGFDGEHVLLPTADDGGIQTPEYAIKKYQRTGRHLGKFSTQKAADAYGGQLHREYERGDYKIASPPEQESPQQPKEPVVGAPLIRQLQQEASQNAVHQQRPTENDYNFDDHLNKLPPEGTVRGSGLKEFIANADEKNASSPQIDYAHAVNSAMREPVFPDGASIGDRIRRQIYADMAGKQAQMPQDSANYAEEQQKIEAHAADVTDKVAGVLAGVHTTNDEGIKNIAANVRAQLKDLSPGGKDASLGHRTQSEADQAQKDYGANAIHTFTPDGARNHKALAISELLDAKDNSQSGFFRGIETAAKTVGGFTQPLWHLIKEGSLPRDTGGTWASLGKDPLESAAQSWADYRGSDGTNAYDPAGKSYFNKYDPTTVRGLEATTQGNQVFPLAKFYQNVASPMYDIAQNVTMPNYYQDAKSLRALHTTTPIIPDGVDPKVAKGHLDTFDNAAEKLTGYNSAYHGRKFADFGNALAGPNTFKRTYLSPIANMALDLPPEIFGDALNLGVSAAFPPVAGVMSMLKAAPLGFKAAKGAGLYSLGRATLKAPFTFKDDLLVEGATAPAIMAGATGIEGLFTPEKTNALMGDADPNAPGYDERLNEAAIAERERLQGSAAAYGKLAPPPKKPQTPGRIYPYIER